MFKENWGSKNIPIESSGRGQGLVAIRRITWGAVFAGVAVALVVQMVLSLLGLGIGIGAVDPTSANPLSGIGTGTLIWWVASMLISLFAGGYVAGRLAGIPGKADSLLHGLLTWAVFTLFSFYLLTTAVGGIFNTVGNVISKSLTVAGNVAGDVAGSQQGQEAISNIPTDRIQQEINQIQQQLNQMQQSQQTQQTAEDIKKTASRAGIFGSIGLILGGIVAAVGGLAGRPKDLAEVTVPAKEPVYKA